MSMCAITSTADWMSEPNAQIKIKEISQGFKNPSQMSEGENASNPKKLIQARTGVEQFALRFSVTASFLIAL